MHFELKKLFLAFAPNTLSSPLFSTTVEVDPQDGKNKERTDDNPKIRVYKSN